MKREKQTDLVITGIKDNVDLRTLVSLITLKFAITKTIVSMDLPAGTFMPDTEINLF